MPALIRSAVDDLIRSGVEPTAESFDGWHEDLCKSIFECACNYGNGEKRLFKKTGFTYGHAQKWVNMTLKYMHVMGLWKRELCRYKGLLHVPIDSYVLEVARGDLGIRAPWASLKKIVKYDEYLKYQKDIRAALEDCDETPIDWESHAWITAAERAKGAPASER